MVIDHNVPSLRNIEAALVRALLDAQKRKGAKDAMLLADTERILGMVQQLIGSVNAVIKPLKL